MTTHRPPNAAPERFAPRTYAPRTRNGMPTKPRSWWAKLPNDQRQKPVAGFSLSHEEIENLAVIAAHYGESKSVMVGRIIMDAYEALPKHAKSK